MTVLVLDGEQRSALAVTRSLGRAGVNVCVGETHTPCLAGASRYSARQFCYPSPQDFTQRFVESLRTELESQQYDLLLPMTDITMQIVADARVTFPPSVRIPFPGSQQVNLVQDKGYILETARRLGISCPQTYPITNENLEEVARQITYPVVIKPRFSRLNRGGKWVTGSVKYALDPASFILIYRKAHAAIPCPLVQEKLEGEGRGVFLLIWNGELKAALCHRRIREKPPWGGVSVYCESLPFDRELVDQSYQLLKSVGWEGVAMVEFKMDARDRQPKLMEVNGRFWGSLQLAIDSGMNFPWLLCRCAEGETVPSQFEYKVGVKSRWLLGDLDHLLIKLTHSQSTDGKKYSWGNRASTAMSFLKFYEKGLCYEVQQIGDMSPAWHEVKAYLRHGLRRGMGDHGRSGAA